ncbi:MAG: hypothetical protein APR63_02695 [Desulfuromonas sp. SDB]|nr:MAG: hypothetical protein APR63_02695 [Desulfuromonas sp. SDB]
MGSEESRQKNLDDNLDKIKHKIVVISGKGGVGKTTVAINLGYGLALAGKKVGIIDADIHGPNVVKMLGIEGRRLEPGTDNEAPSPVKVAENLYALSLATFMENQDDPIIWRGPLKMKLLQQFMEDIIWPPLDYLVVDCPPGTGDEPLSVVQILKQLDGSIIVSTPQDVAFLDSRKAIKFSQKVNVPVLGIVENMSAFNCPHCGKQIDLFSGVGAKKAAEDFNTEILGSIPIDLNIVKSGDQGKPFIYNFKKTPAGKEMLEIVAKITDKVEKNT